MCQELVLRNKRTKSVLIHALEFTVETDRKSHMHMGCGIESVIPAVGMCCHGNTETLSD